MTEKTDNNAAARHAFRACMIHDWVDVTMMHFAVPPRVVAAMTPYEPDVWSGDAGGYDEAGETGSLAFISLVMFTLNRMRTPVWPALGRALLRPISDHRFVNLRTYVRHRGEPGIYFIREWLDNRLSVALGPATFGLPYHLGRITDRTLHAPQGKLAWRTDDQAPDARFAPAAPGSVDAFLLERYTAFTQLRRRPGCFRIRHDPWPMRRVAATVTDDTLLRATTGDWLDHAPLALAHQSPGVYGVEISQPCRIRITPSNDHAPRRRPRTRKTVIHRPHLNHRKSAPRRGHLSESAGRSE